MRIYTLNVNGFRGAEMQPGEYVSPQDLQMNLHNFMTLIGDIITDDQSILIVQEFPHMTGDRSGRWFRWLENDFYNKCLETIKAKYRVIQPMHLIKSEQCTIAICKETSPWEQITEEMIQYDSKHSYGNRLVELQYGDITLLGIHMKPNDLMWNMLLKAMNGRRKYTFIAGDFNAYEHRGDMKDKPKQIRAVGYTPFVPSSVITDTKFNSSIDNIYMDNGYMTAEEITVDIGKSDAFQTDHLLCGIEFAEKKVRDD